MGPTFQTFNKNPGCGCERRWATVQGVMVTVAYQILWLFYTLGGRSGVVRLLSWSLLLLTTLESLSEQEHTTAKQVPQTTAISTKHKLPMNLCSWSCLWKGLGGTRLRSQVKVPPVTTGEKKQTFLHLTPNPGSSKIVKFGSWLRLGKDKTSGCA